ncbi:MAG: glycerol-3-phosphate acyltransferase [Hydrogeniiclostridium mannosilyticum]
MDRYVFFIIIGFLSGSILYSWLLPKIFCHVDVTKYSSDHNPGTANAMKYAGVGMGSVCLLCDVGKGFVPVFVAAQQLERTGVLFSLLIAAPVAGHAFSPWKKGKGGKAIATAFGVLLALLPYSYVVLILAASYLFFSLVLVINPHRLRTIFSFFVLCAAAYLLKINIFIVYACLLISGIVIIKNLTPEENEAKQWRLLGRKLF